MGVGVCAQKIGQADLGKQGQQTWVTFLFLQIAGKSGIHVSIFFLKNNIRH